MALSTTSRMLLEAQAGGYAVPAFNVENMEMMQAVVEAAQAQSAPLILQTTPSTLRYASARLFQAMAQALAENATVPVALHLDHGSSFELCAEALAAGYNSVMIDGSTLPFAENIAVSRRVVELARQRNIPVEAELGSVGGKEDGHVVLDEDALYTNPEQAAEFVAASGVNSLAVAIGTAHGHYKGEPKLDFKRLEAVRAKVEVPLVLHGTSGVPDAAVQRCIGLGICKVNYATELRDAYSAAVREVLEDAKVYDPKAYGKAARQRVRELVEHKLRMCGAAGKA